MAWVVECETHRGWEEVAREECEEKAKRIADFWKRGAPSLNSVRMRKVKD